LLEWHAKGPRIATSCIGIFVGLFQAGALQPHKCLIVVAETHIRVHHGACRDVAGLLTFFRFLNEPERIRPSSGAGVCPDQRTENSGASIRDS
jgi:hypothetical protein